MPCLLPACNEEVAAPNQAVVAGSFAILQPDSFEVPYGEYPHSVGIQVFDRGAAQAMANELASLLGRLTRGFRGVPVYAGHPDHPDARLAAQYPDRRARGWIKEIVVGDNSARFVVSYNELGRSEVEDAQWAGYSPFWMMRPIPAANGKPGMRFRPTLLRSMALTNNPNIPVPPLIAANEQEPEAEAPSPPEKHNAMNLKPETLAKLMKLLSMTEEPDEETLNARLGTYCDERLTEAGNGCPPKPEAANEALTQMQQDVTAAVNAANEAASSLRATRVDFAIDNLITSGRLSAAEREATRTRLLAAANDSSLSQEIDRLRAVKPSMQTQASHSAGLAAQRPAVAAANEAQDRQREREEAVSAVRKERPQISSTQAWGIAASRNPELFSH